MSHYAEIAVEFSQKNEQQLIEALEEQFGKGNVEVHETPAPMFDWHGRALSEENKSQDLWAPPCNIIVRQSAQSEKAGHRVLSNDAGYVRTEDGGYKAYIDKAGFTEELQGLVSQSYGIKTFEKMARQKGFMVTRKTQADGTVQLEAKVYA